jgi:hypothetical protein
MNHRTFSEGLALHKKQQKGETQQRGSQHTQKLMILE